MAKIAVVGWHPFFGPTDNGGAAVIYKNIAQVVRDRGHQVLTVTATDNGKKHKDMIVDYVTTFDKMAEFLNKFDAVLFPTTTPYSTNDHKSNKAGVNEERAQIVIGELRKPFFYWVNGEDEIPEWGCAIYDSNPYCKGLALITEGLEKYYTYKHRTAIYCAGWRSIDKDAAILRSRSKSNIVVSTARIVPEKHVIEICRAAEAITKIGYEVDIWGPKMHWFTYASMLELAGWTYKGGFAHAEIDKVLTSARFHWGGLNPWRRIKFARRIELVTIEAVQYGCIPILNNTSNPFWYNIPVYNKWDEIPCMIDQLQDCAEELLPEFIDQANRRGLDANIDKVFDILGVK